MDFPQPIGKFKMSVQKIELEEVQMVEVSDETLEANIQVVGGLWSSNAPVC